MTRYELLVFDWDGTLVDSIGSIVGCTQEALAAARVAVAPAAAIRRTIGLGIREMIDELVPGCDQELFERICKAYRERWFSRFGGRHAPFPGVAALLAGLAAEGYLLAVATAKGRRGLELELESTGLGASIHASRTVDEAPAKPHPGMLEGLMAELGTSPPRTLMIGDTAHDLMMAANAGTGALGVLSGSHTRAELERVPHLAILDGVRGLSAWLASSPPRAEKRRPPAG
ncbi:MAG: HAD-IA family hydrolase [Acidobacteriota bacterium]|nr:HAD-IA family hydrolase [Acidobacteriota bacterium]MDH3522276.1 HAD-IA family hydrolase [Acidobacteriota bacterium]